MPRPTKGPRLGGGPAHERLLLANLAAQLFTHRSIQTTEAKAKRVRPLAERLVTFAKRGDLHARRRVLSTIGDKTVVHELFTQIAPLVKDRPGGYTRIVKTGFRKGDNAPMAVIELVLDPVTAKSRTSRTRGGSTATATATAPAASAPAAAAETPAEETPAAETPAADATTPADGEAAVDESATTDATPEGEPADESAPAEADESAPAEADEAQANVPGTADAPAATDEEPASGSAGGPATA